LVDTNKVNYIYSGEGGISKAYMGYGFKLGKKFSFGFNLAYLFGNLKQNRALEFANELTTVFNSRTQYSNAIGGLSYDYGLQYSAEINDKTKFIFGYTGNAGGALNSRNNIVTTRYKKDLLGDELSTADSTYFAEGTKNKITMPLTHTAGFAFEKTNGWLVGADISYSRWSDYREGTLNPGLNDSYGVVVGGQITPDANAITNYFKLVDYRLGIKYDKTFVQIGNNDINQYAVTFGFGFPLPRNRSSFYKINLSAELGQRGSEKIDLVRDRYLNLHLGFTLNDKWFQKTYIE
jgi:long-subunit fatty acid transport protein